MDLNDVRRLNITNKFKWSYYVLGGRTKWTGMTLEKVMNAARNRKEWEKECVATANCGCSKGGLMS